jgi:hypothetical protein
MKRKSIICLFFVFAFLFATNAFSATYYYKFKKSYYVPTGYTDQRHYIKIFYDPTDKAMVIEVRAHNSSWDDIIESGSISLFVPFQTKLDWSKVGLYVTRSITKTDLTNLSKSVLPDNVCYYEAFKSKFGTLSYQNAVEGIVDGVDATLSMGVALVGALGNGAGALGAGKATWSALSYWLSNYYDDTGWVGDRSSVYPQFVSHGKRSTGEYWGNYGRVVTFSWQAPDFLWGMIDQGYQVVTLKVPIMTWTSDSIPVFGMIKVHDAWNKPYTTLFSKELLISEAN